MKRFWMLLTIAFTAVSLFAATAEARRFGGGASFGKQRSFSQPPIQRAPAAASAAAAQPAAQPQPAGNKWLGPLAGLALGAGLGALFAGGGLNGAMGGIMLAVLIAGAVMFLFAMFRKAQQATRYAASGAPYGGLFEPGRQPVNGGAESAPAAGSVSADFPVEEFLRSAKTSFIRLQAANDRKDLDDIREYTTPETFAELAMQIRERNSIPQKTEVLALNAEFVEVVTEGDQAIASVRLSGQLRENNGTPEDFDEIWNVQKNLRDARSVWLLAGIQQAS